MSRIEGVIDPHFTWKESSRIACITLPVVQALFVSFVLKACSRNYLNTPDPMPAGGAAGRQRTLDQGAARRRHRPDHGR